MEHILVALDGSQAAGDALDEALLLAHETGARVTAVAVQPTVVKSRAVPAAHAPRDPGQILEAARLRARHAGLAIDTLLGAGRPASEIMAAADDVDADLIVVGSRG